LSLEKLKTVWDFTQKLPIQEDMKKEFFERRDFSDILDGDKALHNSNIFKLHYYLTIISDLYIADPYYLKM
jgi:antitoxin component HigA of HigAB toxin-antitoxin module